MTAQGKHRTQPHSNLVPFTPDLTAVSTTLAMVLRRLEEKGYEVRALRLHMEDHGKKAAVVLHLSPGPRIYRSRYYDGVQRVGKYHPQNVGTTRRRNIETLLAYVEGLPTVNAQEV